MMPTAPAAPSPTMTWREQISERQRLQAEQSAKMARYHEKMEAGRQRLNDEAAERAHAAEIERRRIALAGEECRRPGDAIRVESAALG
jgi:hypothetical protein